MNIQRYNQSKFDVMKMNPTDTGEWVRLDDVRRALSELVSAWRSRPYEHPMEYGNELNEAFMLGLIE